MPFHILFDELEEARLAHEQFGSTKKGIAPFYADKYLKIGLQLNEIFDTPRMRARLAKSLAQKNVLVEKLYGRQPVSIDEVVAEVEGWRDRIAPYMDDTTDAPVRGGEGGKAHPRGGPAGYAARP